MDGDCSFLFLSGCGFAVGWLRRALLGVGVVWCGRCVRASFTDLLEEATVAEDRLFSEVGFIDHTQSSQQHREITDAAPRLGSSLRLIASKY